MTPCILYPGVTCREAIGPADPGCPTRWDSDVPVESDSRRCSHWGRPPLSDPAISQYSWYGAGHSVWLGRAPYHLQIRKFGQARESGECFLFKEWNRQYQLSYCVRLVIKFFTCLFEISKVKAQLDECMDEKWALVKVLSDGYICYTNGWMDLVGGW